MKPQSKLLGVAAAGLAALLAPAVADACTGIMLRNTDGSIVHGRTVEFGITLEMDYAVVPRNYAFVGQTPLGRAKLGRQNMQPPASSPSAISPSWTA